MQAASESIKYQSFPWRNVLETKGLKESKFPWWNVSEATRTIWPVPSPACAASPGAPSFGALVGVRCVPGAGSGTREQWTKGLRSQSFA